MKKSPLVTPRLCGTLRSRVRGSPAPAPAAAIEGGCQAGRHPNPHPSPPPPNPQASDPPRPPFIPAATPPPSPHLRAQHVRQPVKGHQGAGGTAQPPEPAAPGPASSSSFPSSARPSARRPAQRLAPLLRLLEVGGGEGGEEGVQLRPALAAELEASVLLHLPFAWLSEWKWWQRCISLE